MSTPIDIPELRKTLCAARAHMDQTVQKEDMERLLRFLALVAVDPSRIISLPYSAAKGFFNMLTIIASEEYIRLYGE